MTLYGLIASLAWTATAVLCVFRADAFARCWLDTRTQQTISAPPLDVPTDLTALAMSESESWAQDQTLATIRERYDTYKDWNKVRSAMGIGTI